MAGLRCRFRFDPKSRSRPPALGAEECHGYLALGGGIRFLPATKPVFTGLCQSDHRQHVCAAALSVSPATFNLHHTLEMEASLSSPLPRLETEAHQGPKTFSGTGSSFSLQVRSDFFFFLVFFSMETALSTHPHPQGIVTTSCPLLASASSLLRWEV